MCIAQVITAWAFLIGAFLETTGKLRSEAVCNVQGAVLDFGGMASVMWSAALAWVLQRTMLTADRATKPLSLRWVSLSCRIWGSCFVLELMLMLLVYDPLHSMNSHDVVPWCNAYSANNFAPGKYDTFGWYSVVYAALAYCVITRTCASSGTRTASCFATNGGTRPMRVCAACWRTTLTRTILSWERTTCSQTMQAQARASGTSTCASCRTSPPLC